VDILDWSLSVWVFNDQFYICAYPRTQSDLNRVIDGFFYILFVNIWMIMCLDRQTVTQVCVHVCPDCVVGPHICGFVCVQSIILWSVWFCNHSIVFPDRGVCMIVGWTYLWFDGPCHWHDFHCEYGLRLYVLCTYCLLCEYMPAYVFVTSSALIKYKFVYGTGHNWSIPGAGSKS